MAGVSRRGSILSDLIALQRRLTVAKTRADFFGCACVEIRERHGFERAIVLSHHEGRLTAEHLGVLPEAMSDAWRRQLLEAPISLVTGSREAELIRRPGVAYRGVGYLTSVLEETLQLRHHVMLPIVPEMQACALLIADRAMPEVTEREHAELGYFAHTVALALTAFELRVRMREMMREWRYLSASTDALMREAFEVSAGLNLAAQNVHLFPLSDSASNTTSDGTLLSARETEIIALMAKGLSNREIAQSLNLSADTVKGYVARVVRKLGASNRVDAVARYVRRIAAA